MPNNITETLALFLTFTFLGLVTLASAILWFSPPLLGLPLHSSPIYPLATIGSASIFIALGLTLWIYR